MTGRSRRDQFDNVPGAVETYSLINAVLSGTAAFYWDSGTGELEVEGNLYCYALSTQPYAGGTVTGITTAGDAVLLSFDRTATNPTPTIARVAQASLAWQDRLDLAPGGARPQGGEGILLLGHRGPDDRFYLRTGQVLENGGAAGLGVSPNRGYTKTASLTGIADYTTVLTGSFSAEDGNPDGSATLVATGLNYPVGTGQLKVYRNGLLLMPDYIGGDFASGDIGTFPSFEASGPRGDYHEVLASGQMGTNIQFYDGFVPGVGEHLQFVLE